MILVDLPAGTTLYRAHTPQWASRPLSGKGAALQGGRFNRPGVPALYLSLDAETALSEYRQTSPFLPPCTLCSYTVTLHDLVDLRQLHQGTPWDPRWLDWQDDWRLSKFEHGVDPITWVLADMVLEQGHSGIIFPSQTHPDGTNIVVFNDRLQGGNAIVVNDPDGQLPRDRSSWID